jgi:N-glycosylase/DNA lyase
MIRLVTPGFSLIHTLASGQLFRYEEVDDGFLVSHGSRAFVIHQEGNELVIPHATPNVTAEWLEHFFALDDAPPQPVDAYSAQALAFCGGMRVCRQEPWECLIGFLASQNNHVPRIRQIMTGLARTYGERVALGPYTAFTFPEPGTIVSDTSLDALKAGYRAAYFVHASATLTHEILEGIHGLAYSDAKEVLMEIPGVGPKVADCILLFAYGHRSAFPIDTHVAAIMREHYRARTTSSMQRKARTLFGENAGVMQQYLFHYRRHTLRRHPPEVSRR